MTTEGPTRAHRKMQPLWKKRDAKSHEVVTEWRCECGEIVTDPYAHRASREVTGVAEGAEQEAML